MASLPATHPSLSLYLTDSTLTPLLSSASATSVTPQSDSLSALTAASLSTYNSAARLGLGLPQRIMLETRSGPIVLHSFLNPQQPHSYNHRELGGGRHGIEAMDHMALLEETRGALRPLSASTDAETVVETGEESEESLLEVARGNGRSMVNGQSKGKEVKLVDTEDDETAVSLAPLLIGTVVAAGRENMREARRAAAELEKIGVRFQRELVREQQTMRNGGTDEQEGD